MPKPVDISRLRQIITELQLRSIPSNAAEQLELLKKSSTALINILSDICMDSDSYKLNLKSILNTIISEAKALEREVERVVSGNIQESVPLPTWFDYVFSRRYLNPRSRRLEKLYDLALKLVVAYDQQITNTQEMFRNNKAIVKQCRKVNKKLAFSMSYIHEACFVY